MKKSHLLKKAGCLALSAFLTAAMFTGCGGNGSKETQQTDGTPGNADSAKNDSAAGTSAQSGGDQRKTLTIAVQSSPNVIDFETNTFTGLLEEELNVNLDFVLLPVNVDEARTKITLWANDPKTKLPDVFCTYCFDSTMENEYGSKGIIIPVDEYLSDPEISPCYLANRSEADRDFIEKCMRSLDGRIYSIPRYDVHVWNESCYRAWINTQWLDTLNLEMPSTLDEMHEVLTAFKNNDPNGNGKKDEVPLAGSTGWGGDFTVFFLNSFLYANPGMSYFDQKDGTVFPSYTQDKWKEGLQMLNQWMDEGLIDPLSFTQDGTQSKALINQIPEGMVGVVTAGSYSNFDTGILGKNTVKLVPPLKGPDGFATTPTTPTVPTSLWQITKDCEDPGLAARLADLFWDPDFFLSGMYGEKGVDWSEDPAVMEDYWLAPEYEAEGYKLEQVYINQIYASPTPQNKAWTTCYPGGIDWEIKPKWASSDILKKDAVEEPTYIATIDFDKYYTPVFRPKEDLISRFAYTQEESEQISDIRTVINDYVATSMSEFIIGGRAFSEWDAYLDELDDMGLQTLIEVNQKAYDRANGQ